ncbi:virulence factor SrfC family protein [Pacificispira sp.]|uniref:virulence factor SrfC family protein n=1 Tax=Pacificispira sp. TaxID=2888761 RepID=UPI003BAA13E3
MSSDELKTRCESVAKAIRAAQDWVTDAENAELVGAERNAIVKELRRDERRTRQLADAADRTMSIGVYGPSQAGKSYLVSVLAKPRDERLIAAVGAGMDFIEEINPEGDKEATGLVTRFTMQKEDCPPDYPVSLRFLSEADLIRILANTFMRDGDNTEAPPTSGEIAQRLSAARAAMGNGSGLSEEEVWDIQNYFEAHFSGIAYSAGLMSFWEEASTILPALSIAERAKLLSLLWGEHETLTALYVELAQGLEKLGHADKVFAGIESLTPRTTSIIDVATLYGLDGKGDTGPINVMSASGKKVALPRQVVTALTAELILPMTKEPWPLFAEADLLDFPGVRERRAAKGPLDNFIRHSEAPKKELFLRGKVGFLFERYVERQDLTSMLLCVPPSNVDVAADLSQSISEWISKAQGDTPEERQKVDTLLFLVLTKFDMHLADKAGSVDADQRFMNRIEASLIAPFGSLKDSWPLNWKPGRQFNNSFWLRNPNFPAEHVINYKDGVEDSLRDDKMQRLEELRAGCVSAGLVKTHFADPEMAWQAAMSLNDGGVGYLIDNLTPVAKPEVKEGQIDARLQAICGTVRNYLKPFYSDSDIEKRVKARQAVAMSVLKELRVAFENRTFGKIIESFGIDSSELIWRMERVPDNVQIVTGETDPSSVAFDWLPEGMDLPDAEASEADAGDDSVVSMTREAFLTDSAIGAWHEHMRRLSERNGLKVELYVSGNSVAEMASEMKRAAKRFGLSPKIEADIKIWTDLQADVPTLAAVAAHHINNLVESVGASLIETDKRPTLKNSKTNEERPVFTPPPEHQDALSLTETPPRRDLIYFQDWTRMLFQVFDDNARSEDGSTINIEQNARLGSTLKVLDDIGNGDQP